MCVPVWYVSVIRERYFISCRSNNSIKLTNARNYRPCFAKTSQNARFLLSENERFGLVFVKTGSINSGTGEPEGGIEEGGNN
jgi:hypothetical protein